MAKKPFYITTPVIIPVITCISATPQALADSIARYKRLAGYDVLFVTGSTSMAENPAQSDGEGRYAAGLRRRHCRRFSKKLWRQARCFQRRFYPYQRTAPSCCSAEDFPADLRQERYLQSEYEGLYYTPCETFWLERQLVDGKCPDCGRPVEKVKEESYFFRMSKYEKRWLQYIEGPSRLYPAGFAPQ